MGGMGKAQQTTQPAKAGNPVTLPKNRLEPITGTVSNRRLRYGGQQAGSGMPPPPTTNGQGQPQGGAPAPIIAPPVNVAMQQPGQMKQPQGAPPPQAPQQPQAPAPQPAPAPQGSQPPPPPAPEAQAQQPAPEQGQPQTADLKTILQQLMAEKRSS